MPIKTDIWTVDAAPTKLVPSRLPSEQFLEDMIVNAPDILSDEWMLIGRQESTGMGGRIDLLAVAPDGALVLIELNGIALRVRSLLKRLITLFGLKNYAATKSN